MNKQVFVDAGFGQKGYWAWFLLFCLMGLVYKMFTLVGAYSAGYKDIPEIIVFFIFTFNLLLLAVGFMIVIQGLKTAQRIEWKEDVLNIRLYFGRHFQINIEDVHSIEEDTQNRYLKNFITPLGRGGKIYKIQTKDTFFYINAVMDNAHLFVEGVSKIIINKI